MRLLLLTILFPCCSFAQSLLYWEPEITVADGSVFGNIRPRIALNASDEPIVVMGKGSSNKVFSSKWNGTSFSTPIDLLPSDMGAYLATWTGPDIAAKGDTVIIVVKEVDLDNGHIYTVRSTDGGNTFSDTIRVDNHPNGVVWLPSMDIDENGNPSIVFMAHESGWSAPRYHVAHSLDQGITYQNALDVASSIPQEACDCCPAEYVISGNNHVMLYRNNDNNIRDIYGVYSADDGVNYSAENIDQLGWNVTSCPSTGPHGLFTSSGLLTVYASRASGSYRVYLSESTTASGLQFVQSTMLTPPVNTNGIQNHPRISGSADSVFIVWQESESSNLDIMCAYSLNGDLSMIQSTKHLVNSNTSGSQTNPDVIYRNGYVHLVYQDGASGDVIYRRGKMSAATLTEDVEISFEIYPNPTENSRFIVEKSNQDKISSLKVIDKKGIPVKIEVNESFDQFEILLKDESKGIYMLEITLDSGKSNYYKLILN
jgi:hypothetical protein